MLTAVLLGGRRLSLPAIAPVALPEVLRTLEEVRGVLKPSMHRSSRLNPNANPNPICHEGGNSMALQFATNAARNNVGTTAQDDRPKAQVWLNVGVNAEIANPDTGETETVFIALPVGIPLDTMEGMEIRGSNPNWAHMVQAKNALLSELQRMSRNIDAGGDEIVDGLQIQLKRVGQAQTPAKDDNPFLTAMAGCLSVVK